MTWGSSEEIVHRRERNAARHPREHALVPNLGGRLVERTPRGTRERAADADTTHAGLLQLCHRREPTPDEHVDRPRRDRAHDRPDLLHRPETRREQTLGT